MLNALANRLLFLSMIILSTPSVLAQNNLSSSRISTAYLADTARRVKRVWFPPEGNEQVVATCHVSSIGSVTDVKAISPNSHTPASAAAISAIKKALPMRRLPYSTAKPVAIKLTFNFPNVTAAIAE